MPLIKLTLHSDGSAIYIESNHISAVNTWGDGDGYSSVVSVISGSGFLVKESQQAIIEAINDATDDDCYFDPDVKFELTPFAEECLREAKKKVAEKPVGGWQKAEYPAIRPTSRIDPKLIGEFKRADIEQYVRWLHGELDEAQSDAKVADERAEWHKKLADERLKAIEKAAAVEKGIRSELSVARLETNSIGAWHNFAIGTITQRNEAIQKLEAQIAELRQSETMLTESVRKEHRDLVAERLANLGLEDKLAKQTTALENACRDLAVGGIARSDLERKLAEQTKELAEWRTGKRSPWIPCAGSGNGSGGTSSAPFPSTPNDFNWVK